MSVVIRLSPVTCVGSDLCRVMSLRRVVFAAMTPQRAIQKESLALDGDASGGGKVMQPGDPAHACRLPKPRWRGVFTILMSPFGGDGSLSLGGLRAQVDFARACGVQGVVFPGVASESYTLSDAERQRGVEAVVEQASGQLPVLAGVTASSGPHAAALARHAAQTGADGAMVMAPALLRLEDADLRAYFDSVAGASGLPLILQSFTPPIGAPLSVAQITRLVCEVPNIRYVKQEVPPTPHNVSALLDLLGQAIEGIFGGAGGLHALEELRRGACGTMPGVHLAPAAEAMWDAFIRGDDQLASEVHRTILPAVNRSLLLGPRFAKSVLVRRGVLTSAATRVPSPHPNTHDDEELERILKDLQSYWPASE
ncbi:MAG: hypothetical protein GEU78_15415 [Actinobacteria bacterium]|nr:hypothetical protein [Actinomycetota bacterium]